MEATPHLKHLHIEGFKSIKSVALDFQGINLLVGANGSGKSNFISIFSLLRAIAEGKFQQYIADNGQVGNLLHFGPKHTKQLKLYVEAGENAWTAALGLNTENTLYFIDEFCEYNWSQKKYPLSGRNGESGLYAGETESEGVRKHTREYLRECQVFHFHDTGETAPSKQTTYLDRGYKLESDAANIAAFLYRLREEEERTYFEIVETVRSIAPFFHDFLLEPMGKSATRSLALRWLHKKYTTSFSAFQLSDGTLRFICLAALLLQPGETRPRTIVIDEPELGLHPFALAVLADMIKQVAADGGQVICTTQSVTLINHFAPEDIIVVEQDEKGVSTFKRPNPEALEHWLDEFGMGDIWNKNLIGGRP
jgi:predicted ATPase